MKRRLKQLAYLTLFFAFWGGIVWLGYASLFRQAPSCFDGTQNQGEEGPDCGGPCKAFCLPKNLTTPSALGEPRVFQPAPNVVAVLIELKNPNVSAGARQLPYQVTMSGTGTPLVLKGVASLYPTEVRRLVLVRPTALTGTLSATLSVDASSTQWSAAEVFKKPALSVVNAVTTSSESGVRVEGTVASDDALAVTDVTALALFYDRAGALLGASQTVLPRLAAGGVAPFTISYPPLPGIDPEATQVSVSAYRP